METDVTQRLKILIVEDDIVDRKLLQRLLSQSALSISDIKSAECLDTALGFLDKEQFDVVFLDLGLPDSQGIDSFSAICAKAPAVAVIVVSGLDDAETTVMAAKKGVQDYLVKGQVDSNLLTRTVRYAVERKKVGEQLRQAEEKYRMQFEGALDAIFVAEAETGILIDCNPAATRLVGREKSELIGQHQQILHPPERIEGGFSRTFKQHLKEKQGQVLETQVITKNGEVKDVAIKANLLEIGGKKVLQGIFRDVTERKRAEEKLKETMETKSQFISTVSHELRTPLTSVKEAIAIVSDEVAGKINKDQRHFLDIAKRNINRLSRLVNEVLDFQKMSANKMEFHIQENNIKEVIKDTYHTMTAFAQKKGVNLSIELDGNLPKARFDSDGIVQVLTNLISNAIKFTPENGRVSVRAQQQDEDLVIRVSDSGKGIPKEALTKIFDPFYQAHQPGHEAKGTGLGLPIVNKIVMAHGGRIEVESEVGKGATFSVFLPLDGKPTPEVLPEEMDELLENSLVNNQAHTK